MPGVRGQGAPVSCGPEGTSGSQESRTNSLQLDPMAGLFQLHIAEAHLQVAQTIQKPGRVKFVLGSCIRLFQQQVLYDDSTGLLCLPLSLLISSGLPVPIVSPHSSRCQDSTNFIVKLPTKRAFLSQLVH